MQSSIAQFMKVALTVVVIAGLLFAVGYQMVDSEVTGAGGYKSSVDSKSAPSTTAPPAAR